jgi:hypothetical protein
LAWGARVEKGCGVLPFAGKWKKGVKASKQDRQTRIMGISYWCIEGNNESEQLQREQMGSQGEEKVERG